MAGKSYVLSSLWATGPLTPISQLHAGTGGTIDPQGLYPKPVLDTMTNLYNPIVTLPVSYIQNTATPSTSFVANMDTGTGNNQLITEAGLFTSSGIMFNIKTFPGIPKTSEFSLNFNWTVTIA